MENPSPAQRAAAAAIQQRNLNRAIEHLTGIVTGIVSDGHLHDNEVLFLRTWLTEQQEAATVFPGSVIARKVSDVLADGVITPQERDYLLETLHALASNNFSLTGSASPEVTQLPINDAVTINLPDSIVCLTGEFLYGTRAACERLILTTGAMCTDSVSKKVDILAVGHKVSPNWAHTSYGRKIQRAIELQEDGHPIEIISEQRLIEAIA